MISITRKFEFDAAHRVLGHENRCRFIHGHRYVAYVTIQAPELNHLGMVMDFGLVKELIGKWIDKYWDHNILLNTDDPLAKTLLETEQREPFFFAKTNPTAEVIAQALFLAAVDLLSKEMQVIRVRVYETPNCYADYKP